MTAQIRHRGPDDEGAVLLAPQVQNSWVSGGKDTPESVFQSSYPYCPTKEPGRLPSVVAGALGHRRLAIVDVSPAGHQPMCSQDGRLWITYNGEIYNHVELRRELKALGHHFFSSSDTEVILAAYRTWGTRCLSRFNGMFSFVLYDGWNKKIFAARDRFGVKPLYYWVSPEGWLALASEIKQFTVLPGWQATVNGQRVYDFLTWGITDHTNETLFRGVQQLQGGEFLLCDLETAFSPRIERWYELKITPFRGSFADATERSRWLFEDAVRLRLRADVSVGSCLSGGLDSSSIVCVVNSLLKGQRAEERQKTFSACSHEASIDERRHIDKVVTHCNVDAHYCYPAVEELFDRRSSLVWHQDEPFGSTSIFAQWEVFKLAHQHQVKVMLDGQGADEQFIGYHLFFSNRFLELLKRGRWGSLMRDMIATSRLHGFESTSHLLRGVLPGSWKRVLKKLLRRSDGTTHYLDLTLLRAQPRDFFGGASTRLTVNELSLLQMTQSNLPMLLHWEDRNAMAHSVESRTPFLDYRLVEFVCGLPSDFKLRRGWTKRVLREAMRGILPEEIRMRVDKIGFATPEALWIRKHAKFFRQMVESAVEASGGILTPETLVMADEMILGKRPFSFWLWRLVNFGDWVRRFNVKTSQTTIEEVVERAAKEDTHHQLFLSAH